MSTVKAHTLADVTPALSLQPINFAAKDPGVGGWRPLLAQGVGADKAGIDRLVVSDHVILGENLDKYGDPSAGGTEGGVQPTGPEGHWLDPLTVISMWAATTTHTRFMTGILLAGLRRPATLAKQLSTIDVLSEGRLDIGVGVGWQREEYEANGVSYKGRGQLLDQTLEICQTLWTVEAAAYSSPKYSFEKIHLNPKPPRVRRNSALDQRHAQQERTATDRALRDWLDSVGSGCDGPDRKSRQDRRRDGKGRPRYEGLPGRLVSSGRRGRRQD